MARLERARCAQLAQKTANTGPKFGAKIWIAPLHAAADIDWLLDELATLQLQSSQQLWVVRGKGPHALVNESLLMAALRQIRLTPSKTASISDSLTADRYAIARGGVSSSRTQ